MFKTSAVVLNDGRRIEIKEWSLNYLTNVVEITNSFEGWKTYEPKPCRWQVQIVTNGSINYQRWYRLELIDEIGNIHIFNQAFRSPYVGSKKIDGKPYTRILFYGNGKTKGA